MMKHHQSWVPKAVRLLNRKRYYFLMILILWTRLMTIEIDFDGRTYVISFSFQYSIFWHIYDHYSIICLAAIRCKVQEVTLFTLDTITLKISHYQDFKGRVSEAIMLDFVFWDFRFLECNDQSEKRNFIWCFVALMLSQIFS